MDNRKDLSPLEAVELLREVYPDSIQQLAKLRYFQRISFFNTKTHRLREEVYLDLGTARKVSYAVRLMEIIDGKSIKWNKDELRILFNEDPKKRQPKN